MTIDTTNIITPVLAAPEVVVLFLARVTGKTGFGNVLGRFAFEGNDLLGISLFSVRFTWAMAGFAPSHLIFPAAYVGKLRVGRVRERLELILMAVLTNLTADVIGRLRLRDFGRADLRRLRGIVVAEPPERGENKSADQECFDESTHSVSPP